MNVRRRRVRFRPPGVKPGGKVGPWGPFRGRLGAHWWIAAVVTGVSLLGVIGWYLIVGSRPDPPWRAVGTLETLAPGEAREALPGIFIGRLEDGRAVAVREDPACLLVATESRYRDCQGTLYHLNGEAEAQGARLPTVPLQVHRGQIYVRR